MHPPVVYVVNGTPAIEGWFSVLTAAEAAAWRERGRTVVEYVPHAVPVKPWAPSPVVHFPGPPGRTACGWDDRPTSDRRIKVTCRACMSTRAFSGATA